MEQAVRLEQPDGVLHLGDCVRDAEALAHLGLPLWNVPGNCDYRPDLPDILTPEFEGVRLFMTHGHLHSVKMQYMRILYAGLEAEANVVLFGHTHRPECFFERGMWVMNPGACGYGGTYGVLSIQDGAPECRIRSVPSEK